MTDVIRTERLVLRRFRRDDAARLVALLNDLDVSRWLTAVPYPYENEDAVEFVESLADAQNAYAITCNSNLIGCIALGNELGYWIEKGSWGQGYVTEAARVLVSKHFAENNDEVKSGFNLGNERSKAVLSKLGFKAGDQYPAQVKATSEEVMIQGVSLSRSDWEAVQ